MIHFCRRELVLECLNGARCQCSTLIVSPIKARLTKTLRGGTDFTWEETVREYSTLDLSYTSDRLPAISALARRFPRADGERYLAGMWESALPLSVGWHVPLGHSKCCRAAEPRPPSWSWASISSQVISGRYTENEFIPIRMHHVQCETASKDAFGKIKSGKLTIEGAVSNFSLQWSYLNSSPRAGTWSFDKLDIIWDNVAIKGKVARRKASQNTTFFPDYHFHLHDRFHCPLAVSCLWLPVTANYTDMIVLHALAGGDEFERLGILRVADEDLWTDYKIEEKLLNIV
jgi:hypothetical protein